MYLFFVVAIQGYKQALYQLSSMILESAARYGQPLAFVEGFVQVGGKGGWGTGDHQLSKFGVWPQCGQITQSAHYFFAQYLHLKELSSPS